MIDAGQLYLPVEAPWLGEFKHELLGFPSTRHADQIDALSQLLAWVARESRNQTPMVGPMVLSWEDDGTYSWSDGSIDQPYSEYVDDPWMGWVGTAKA